MRAAVSLVAAVALAPFVARAQPAQHIVDESAAPGVPEKAADVGWIQASHDLLERGINALVLDLDRFFGEPAHEPYEPPTSHVRLRSEARTGQDDSLQAGMSVGGYLRLPTADRRLARLRLFFTGETKPNPSPGLDVDLVPPRFHARLRSASGGVELRVDLARARRTLLDVGAGVRFGMPPPPFSRVRLAQGFPLGVRLVGHLSQSLFWDRREGLGETSRLDVERAFGTRTLGRWWATGTVDGVSRGYEWASELGVQRVLGPRTGLYAAAAIAGATGASPDVDRYRIHARLRRDVYAGWAFVEVEPEIAWPVDEITSRRSRVLAATLRLEVQFSTDGRRPRPGRDGAARIGRSGRQGRARTQRALRLRRDHLGRGEDAGDASPRAAQGEGRGARRLRRREPHGRHPPRRLRDAGAPLDRRAGELHRSGRGHLARDRALVPRGRRSVRGHRLVRAAGGDVREVGRGVPRRGRRRGRRPHRRHRALAPGAGGRGPEPHVVPVVAAGGVDAEDVGSHLAKGIAGVQLATRFIACCDGDTHRRFKEMHLGKTDDDVVVITSRVKGMKARAIRNAFTDALAAGRRFPPRSKAWFFGPEGYRGRTKACIDCLADGVCKCKASGFEESFCITDALLRAAVLGDEENGLFYTGQSVTRIEERNVAELTSAAELVERLEDTLTRWEAGRSPARVDVAPELPAQWSATQIWSGGGSP